MNLPPNLVNKQQKQYYTLQSYITRHGHCVYVFANCKKVQKTHLMASRLAEENGNL